MENVDLSGQPPKPVTPEAVLWQSGEMVMTGTQLDVSVGNDFLPVGKRFVVTISQLD